MRRRIGKTIAGPVNGAANTPEETPFYEINGQCAERARNVFLASVVSLRILLRNGFFP
jgi:hypothetical protein